MKNVSNYHVDKTENYYPSDFEYHHGSAPFTAQNNKL